MNLSELVDAYLLSHEVRSNTEVQIRYAVKGVEKHHGTTLQVSELSADVLNRYILSLTKAGQFRYAKTHRTWLMSLLRAALELGELQELPRNVRRVKVPESIPTAWTCEQVTQLVQTAQAMPGVFRMHPHVPKSIWFTAYALVRWDTALRMADVLSIERTDIWPGGQISIVQHKTGHAHSVLLSKDTQEALRRLWKLLPESRMILPSLCEPRRIYSEFKRLVKLAGLEGTGRKLRISSATAAEAIEPGAATKLLGHRTPDMARRHYIDPRLLNRAPVAPPALPKIG